MKPPGPHRCMVARQPVSQAGGHDKREAKNVKARHESYTDNCVSSCIRIGYIILCRVLGAVMKDRWAAMKRTAIRNLPMPGGHSRPGGGSNTGCDAGKTRQRRSNIFVFAWIAVRHSAIPDNFL